MKQTETGMICRALTEIGAETGHEVSGCDEIHRGSESLKGELETTPDFLFADFAHRTDLLERSRYTLLAAGNVQAGGRFGIIRSPFQILAIVHLLEQVVRPIGNRFRQINPIGHCADFLEGCNQRTIRATHRASVLIFGS